MNKIKPLSLLGIILLFSQLSIGQNRVAGIVIDKKGKEPIIGAKIYLEGTSFGVASDKEGKYEINGIPDGTYKINASYNGYKTEEYSLDIYQNKSVHFRLEQSSINPNAIVVTGTRANKQIRKSPVQTQLISKRTIQTQGATSLQQILTNNNASFEMLKNYTVNSFKFNGLGPQYTLFLIDGERVTGEASGAIDLSKINPANIESIEVVKGAASVLYGSNAIGGVVNVLTRDVSRSVEVNAGIQSTLFSDPASGDGRTQEYAYANLNLNKGKLSSFTDAKINNYSPYDSNEGAGVLGMLTQEKENNLAVNQKLILRLNNQWSFAGNASYYQLDRNFQLQNYPDKKNNVLAYGFKTIFYPTSKSKIELSWHSDQNKIFDILNLGTEIKDSLDYNLLTQNARLLGNIKLSSFNDITIGLEYNQEKQSSIQNNIDNKEIESYAVFLQDEISLSKNLNFTFGARNEFHSIYGTHFASQASALFSVGKFTFRGMYGQGFRTPSIKELYASNLEIPSFEAPYFLNGNPDLKPEESNYYSGSVQFSTEKLDLSASYALNNLEQLITYSDSFNTITASGVIPPFPGGFNYVYKNIDKATIKTLNAFARYRIFNKLTLSASYSYTDAQNLTKNEILPNVRKHNARFNLDFNHSFKKFKVAANFNSSYFGTKEVTNIYSEQKELIELPDYTLFKIMTTITLKKHYMIKLGVDNLLDKIDDQPEFFNLASPGRMLILGVSVSF